MLGQKYGGLKCVISMDLRGMGESDTGFSSYTPEDTGKDIIRLLETLDLHNVVLIGCSMTAASSAYAAASAPQRVRGVCMISPFAWDHAMPFMVPTLLYLLLNTFTGPGFWSSYYRSLYTLKPSTVPDLEQHIKTLKSNVSERGRMKAICGHVFGSKKACSDRFPEIASLPMCVVFGEKDPDFSGVEPEIAEFAARLPQTRGKTTVIAGCGHYPHVERPDEVASALAAFLLSLE